MTRNVAKSFLEPVIKFIYLAATVFFFVHLLNNTHSRKNDHVSMDTCSPEQRKHRETCTFPDTCNQKTLETIISNAGQLACDTQKELCKATIHQ